MAAHMNPQNLDMLDNFEQELENSLAPINPNPEFVYRLRRRLLSEPTIILEQQKNTIMFLVVSLGLFIGALLIWAMRKLH